MVELFESYEQELEDVIKSARTHIKGFPSLPASTFLPNFTFDDSGSKTVTVKKIKDMIMSAENKLK